MQEDTHFDKSQKTVALRRAYHRAVVTPMRNMEALWKKYEQFEQSVGTPEFAKRKLEQFEAPHRTARGVFIEARAARVSLSDEFMLAVHSDPKDEKQQQQVWLPRLRIKMHASVRRVDLSDGTKCPAAGGLAQGVGV